VLAIGGIAATVRLDRPAAEVEARWARPPSKFVDVDGLRVHVRDRGKGPVVVLVHGSNSSLFTWLIPEFSLRAFAATNAAISPSISPLRCPVAMD